MAVAKTGDGPPSLSLDPDSRSPDEQLPRTSKQSTTPVSVCVKDASDRQSSASYKSDEQSVIRKRSKSRDSVNDDPKSIDDSISAISGRHNWTSIRDMADYDPSINSIKGDSVSATIADYNRKHSNRAAGLLDNQSRASCRLDSERSSTVKNDDSSTNLNFCAVSSSSTAGPFPTSSKYNSQTKYIRTKRCNNQKQFGRNSHTSGRHSSALDQAIESYEVPQGSVYQIEPVVIRGTGSLSLFSLSNSFNTEFPPTLLGRVSREEFSRTINQINALLSNQQSISSKLLLFGSLFCCCSLGFSLVWPSIVLRRRSKCHLEKFLASENQRLYSKLGMNWRLGQMYYSRFVEHVLIIEFHPKIDPFIPD